MARAPKAKIVEQVSESTELTNWEEELAAQAQVAAAQEANAGGGNFFSLRGGILTLNDQQLPNNEMAVVILDSILENIFYAGEYDADVLTPPTCFAFGRDDATMAPHQVVIDHGQAQHATCKGCPMNEFGTADRGRGKACGNRRRLAMIPAGSFDKAGRFEPIDEVEHYQSASPAFMKLPVTSVKGYATFVKQVAGVMLRPPHGIYTKVKVVQDAKSQFKVLFEPIAAIPNAIIHAVMKRHKEVATMIEAPYNLDVEETVPATPPERGRGKRVSRDTRPPVKRGTKY